MKEKPFITGMARERFLKKCVCTTVRRAARIWLLPATRKHRDLESEPGPRRSNKPSNTANATSSCLELACAQPEGDHDHLESAHLFSFSF